jgi:hypothetical protein
MRVPEVSDLLQQPNRLVNTSTPAAGVARLRFAGSFHVAEKERVR